ncbi:MAG TPA: hypothetical protein P5531_08975 [Bacteroidales bacterium]|nr:hypothetical protein [Bacteroidales bacterium]HSA43780.1 hypothetical protein [Bacteroidales bacterium]
MTGDILLLTDTHHRLAAEITEKLRAAAKKRWMIAISGESGSGKSELSYAIARRLKDNGLKAKIIHSDNFYVTHPDDRLRIRLERGIEKSVGPGEYDWESIRKVLQAFRKRKTVAMPCVDLLTNQVDTLFTDFSDISVLILDGLYAIKAPGFDLRIFIDLTYHDTKKAQLLRGKEQPDMNRMKVLEAEHRAVRALKPKANILIDATFRLHFL